MQRESWDLKQTVIVAVGLVVFTVVAALSVMIASASDSIKPLMVMWALVPAPLVFLLMRARRPRSRAVRLVGASYLGLSISVVMLMLAGVSWIGSERAIHPAQCTGKPQLSDYPALAAKTQAMRFTSRDGTMRSAWFIPGERKTTVLLLHGYGCIRNEMLPHADMLNRAGYSVFLYDSRNRGESEGDAVTLGFYERSDVLAAIDYLKTRPDVDPSGFGALGISQGAATAIMAAAETQDIRAVAAEASFKSLNSVIGQSFTRFIHLPAFPFAPITVLIAERRVDIRASQIVPERSVAAISPRPVFIMHGALDRTISPDDSRAIFAAAKEPKEFWLIEGSAHAQGALKAPVEYEKRVVAFFNASLK